MARGTRKQRDQHRPSAVDAPGSDRPRPCGATTPRDHRRHRQVRRFRSAVLPRVGARQSSEDADGNLAAAARLGGRALRRRSEEHTSELQSHSDLVCRLLLEKKKKKQITHTIPKKKQNKKKTQH